RFAGFDYPGVSVEQPGRAKARIVLEHPLTQEVACGPIDHFFGGGVDEQIAEVDDLTLRVADGFERQDAVERRGKYARYELLRFFEALHGLDAVVDVAGHGDDFCRLARGRVSDHAGG